MENTISKKNKKPFYKIWWVWLIAGIVILGIIGSIVGVNPVKKDPVVGVNEWAAIGDYQVKVVNVENTKEFGNGYVGHFTTQNNYVCILIELKNNSNYSHTFSYSDFVIKSGSNKYGSKGTEAYWYSEAKGKNYPALYLNGSIDAGLSGKYYLVFETANSTANESYQLVYSYGYNTVTISL